jgi:MOSC domain-containing protein YiiM
MAATGEIMPACIIAIYIAQRGARPTPQSPAQLEAGKGVVGDRYYDGGGTFSEKLAGNRKSEVTFIAAEEIDAFNAAQHETLGYGDVRRNIVTRGVQLRDLIDCEFSIGPVKFLGIEHCEPCAHLAATVNPKVLPHLVHTGLRAAILSSGTIEVGDEVSL